MAPLEFKGVRLGVTICEEVWNDRDFWPRRLYARDPVCDLADSGADVFINISSSPFTTRQGRRPPRDDPAAGESSTAAPLFYVNQVGGNDELLFDGHSLGFDRTARWSCADAISRKTSSSTTFRSVDARRTRAARAASPSQRVAEEEACKALTLGLRDYVRKCGFSHGRARPFRRHRFGADRASRRRSARRAARDRRGDADAVFVWHSLRRCGVARRGISASGSTSIPIDAVFQCLSRRAGAGAAGLAARRRRREHAGAGARRGADGLLEHSGSMLLSTGNKSELAVGYCTLYGDMCGGLAVISDVPKTLVYDLARYVNREREVIPRSSITKAPSAELRPEPDRSGHAAALRRPRSVIEALCGDGISMRMRSPHSESIARPSCACSRRIDRNEYKRRQAAPGLKITSKAFGVGRRYPVARG